MILTGDPQTIKNRVILAIHNTQVDYWNTRLQEMNTNEIRLLQSHDYFAEVDDDHGHLRNLLSDHVMNQMTNTQVPNHELNL